MSYQALYRTWRPQTFADLVGQPHVTRTLTNAILTQQVAHAYLFCGPRGTGKTSAAKVLAKAVNCEHRHGADPCNECPECRSITAGSHVDVEEIDAASNRGVDEIRQLREKVVYAPTGLRRKVYIIDEVHMLTTEAFNALLKTLEEPPVHALFVLATTEPHKIPGTIVSRCQRFDFRRILPEAIAERLALVCSREGWRADEEALYRLAGAADGGLRDALGLLEQTAAYGAGEVTAQHAAHVVGGVDSQAVLRLLISVRTMQVGELVTLLTEWYASGKDAGRIVQDLLQTLRDLFIVRVSAAATAVDSSANTTVQAAAAEFDPAWLLTAIRRLGETYTQLRFVDQPRLALETALFTLIPQPPSATLTAPAASVAVTGTVQERDVPSVKRSTGGNVTHPPAPRPQTARPVGEHVDVAVERPLAAARTAATAQVSAMSNRPASATRKREVLSALYERRSDAMLQRAHSAWTMVIQSIRDDHVGTHGWLVGSEPVLATDQELVVSFISRIHRDAVMKPAQKVVIEQALAVKLEQPCRLLALAREDWEEFISWRRGCEVATAEDDLSEKAIAMFGADVVEIRDGE